MSPSTQIKLLTILCVSTVFFCLICFQFQHDDRFFIMKAIKQMFRTSASTVINGQIWQAMYQKPANGSLIKEIRVAHLVGVALNHCPGDVPCISMGTGYFEGSLTWVKYIKEWYLKGSKVCSRMCHFVDDMAQADAVLFHGKDTFPKPFPWKRRHPDQKFIYLNVEAPWSTRRYGYNLMVNEKYRFLFNLSATYQRTSNITIPHGTFVLRDKPLDKSAELYNKTSKTKILLATNSNCAPFNQRNNKIKLLSTLMGNDLIKEGLCYGNMTPGQYDPNIMMKKSKNYYFFLAYENAFCRDYITEKVFNNALATDCVPVVVGGLSRKEYEDVLPPNSFIYALDFSTMAGLVQYLRKVAANDTLYSSYHEWKRHYRMTGTIREDAQFCRICEKLWETQDSRSTADIKDYYDVDKNCIAKNFTNYLLTTWL